MNENGGSTGTRSEQGSVGVGLLQTFGVYALGLTVFFVLVASRYRPAAGLGTSFEQIGGLSAALNLVLGVRHGRRGRQRTATGYLIGILLWPAIALFLFAWALSSALSHATIPW